MATGVIPIRIGLLYDFPQGDDLFAASMRLGLDEVAATGRLDREIELVDKQARGLPSGSEHDIIRAFGELVDDGAVAIVGPSISDNALIAAPLCDAARIPAINYSGGERTRSQWMFHYQVGSLEEEPPLLVARMGERGFTRAAVIHDASVVGDRYAEVLGWAAADAGVEITGRAAIDPLAEDLTTVVGDLRAADPDVLVYLGLGAASHAVATAMADADWSIPVLANSALMFGYVRPDWRDAWASWEYIDTIAEDNTWRRRLGEQDAAAAAGPIGTATFDMGRLIGHAVGRAERTDRAGLREGLERVKQLPAASGYEGTLMGFGVWDRGALKGPFLVLRAWRDGTTVQVDR